MSDFKIIINDYRPFETFKNNTYKFLEKYKISFGKVVIFTNDKNKNLYKDLNDKLSISTIEKDDYFKKYFKPGQQILYMNSNIKEIYVMNALGNISTTDNLPYILTNLVKDMQECNIKKLGFFPEKDVKKMKPQKNIGNYYFKDNFYFEIYKSEGRDMRVEYIYVDDNDKRQVREYNIEKEKPELIKDGDFYKLYIRKQRLVNKALYFNADKSFYPLSKNKNYIIYDKDTEEVLAIVVRKVLSPVYRKLKKDFFEFYNKIIENNNNRGDIAGVLDYNKVDTHLKKNVKHNNMKFTGSRFSHKTVDNAYTFSNMIWCRSLGIQKKDMTLYKLNRNNNFNQKLFNAYKFYLQEMNKLTKKYYIDLLQNQRLQNNRFFGYYSTLNMNCGIRSACHRDSGNYPDLSLITIMNNRYIKNKFKKGGDLLFPDYNLKLNIRMNQDILFFNGAKITHCNEELVLDDYTTNAKNSRMSFIFYNKY